MNQEILLIVEQFKDSFNGDPWFGRPIVALLKEVQEDIAFEKPSGQHSLLELLWHMVFWREFAISHLEKDSDLPISYFDENDWRVLDHSDTTLWQKGLQQLHQTQEKLVQLLQDLKDTILEEMVFDREYNFRKLFYGLIHHDIYHLGQVAYLTKFLKSSKQKDQS